MITTPATTIQHIRPYRLFSLMEGEGPERVAHVRLSKRRGFAMGSDDETPIPGISDFSLLYLETMAVLAAMKIAGASRVLEFGTHLGATTVNLALNLPAHGHVLTLDLVDVGRFKEWRSFPWDLQKQICAMGGVDSSRFDFSRWGLFDFVWIDGNPDRTDDTRNAFKLIDPGKLSCIGWHDYAADGANTTETVERLAAEGHTIYHIEDTKVCLYFNRPVEL